MKSSFARSLSLFIGLRYTRSRERSRFVSFITLFSTGGIALGVMALIVVVSVMNGFQGVLKTRILGVVPQVVVSNPSQQLAHWSAYSKALEKLPHVTALAPLIIDEAVAQTRGRLQGMELYGIDPKLQPKQDEIANNLLIGSLKSLTPGSYRLILGQGLANQLGVYVGDKVRVLVTRKPIFTPFGQMPSQRLFTVAGIFGVGADVDNTVALTNIQDAGRLLRYPKGEITGVRLWLDDPFAVGETLAKPLPDQLVASDWRATRGELFQAVSMEKHMMGLMLCLIIAVAAFNILSSLVMVISNKRGEVAILLTLGATPGTILRVFVFQGLYSGVLGTLIGGIVGLLATYKLNPLLSMVGLNFYQAVGGMALPVDIRPMQILLIIVGALLMSLFATLYPAYRATKIRPAQELRYE
ncbi:lipoprotein-releasing ABC transporter permease subunit [Dongshaea marina]|uniref:lipoprotein-releasing ABC transporter permease subunit n=1 Tax=Dongshaea marina TaxID=2047966 RepID=UPI000D3ECDB5|nr:lipoprotein-releasing ABC transporter permease subunit [Dongshaea marina]